MWEMPCLSAFCLCVCEWVVPHVSLVLKCGPHSMWLNNEFSRLRTGEPTLLITQINKHADEPQQWNNDNTIGSVSSVADREDNYGYPPTPSLPLLLFSHLPSCLFYLFRSFFYLSYLLHWFLSFFCMFLSVVLSLTLQLFLTSYLSYN